MNNNVLVHVSNGIVESDVIATIREVLSNAHIQVVNTVEAACETLRQYDGWAWAVLDMDEQALGSDELRQALAEKQALPVVLAPPLQDPQVSDWVFIDPPFTTHMLQEALRRTAPF